MDWAVLGVCALIVVARVSDITLDTVRTVFIVQGRRTWAAVLGFFEALIFILAVSKVLQHCDHPAYPLAYALGFAGGTYLGITIEQWLGFGEQSVAIFTRHADVLASALRSSGFRVTKLDGEGRDGPIEVLYVHLPRKQTERLAALVRQHDPLSYYVVQDIRAASGRPAFPSRHRVMA